MAQISRKYEFHALAEDGRIVQGTVSAYSQDGAVKLIEQNGFKLKKISEGIRDEGEEFSISSRLKNKVSSKELMVFSRKFAALIESGIMVVRALEILRQSVVSRQMKNSLDGLIERVTRGESLFQAFSQYPKIFDKTYIYLIKAGEAGGKLDEALIYISKSIEKREAIKNKIRAGLLYPATVISISFLVIGILMVWVIPGFQGLFADSNRELPAITLAVIGVSHFLAAYWWLILFSLLTAFLFFKGYRQTEVGRRQLDELVLKIPLFGKIIFLGEVIRFCQVVGTMVAAGVKIHEALPLGRDVLSNTSISDKLKQIIDQVTTGVSLTRAFVSSGVFPVMVNEMIMVGENSGKLDEMLAKVTEFYEEEVDAALATSSSLIEPVLMMVIGSIVAVILIAMYMPVFSLADVF